ncbi:ABC transporter ATP-binding protein [Paenibacillus durus]|uniref:Sugar ABC transporter ATP-binding protein n=1 Tax=Paenibacillus durus ATCC 35681 TaxID=1333534 RepID=A0A0F7FCW8_PAEDU|nr:sn-glycerol-3-phosphate ABC transporter ATP-binding protein UgpC [Paenibacillus durus]AKG36238.1 sugar ABC transporter ATP-binding protein [Paenibacillus durus ATCC 35681]
MAGILFNHVYKRYGKYKEVVVNDFNLAVNDQEFLVFVGPSGCGKSTTLRMLAGLEDISEGEIYIGDKLVNHEPPKNRNISMVFQNYALYPNLTVYENIAFGLRVRKVPKHEIDLSVKRAARVLEIESFLDRKPSDLSGGQRQRVALGRAIVRTPEVFLMDEPLSNLDAKLRVQMRSEIIRLHKKIGVTTIYVTHDQIEAMTMGDRVVVMNKGVIQQVDTPERIYERPVNMFVASFIGNLPMNFIEGKLRENDGYLDFCTNRGSLRLTAGQAARLRKSRLINRDITMGIRAEHISFDEAAIEANPHSLMTGFTMFNEFVGSDRFYHMDIRSGKLLIARSQCLREEGERVTMAIDMEKALFFNKDTEMLLTE